MSCSDWTAELVECARRPGRERQPGRELRAHINVCTQCRERWDAELLLNSHFRTIRSRTASLSSESVSSRASRREDLMNQFRRRHRRAAVVPSWRWGLAAAAGMVLAVSLGYMAGRPARKTVHEVRTKPVRLYEARQMLSTDASALSSDEFMAIPYTPPLAPGEMVRVLHADLDADALASMGVDVDPSSSERLPADVVVGEDGLPRAVRITEGN